MNMSIHNEHRDLVRRLIKSGESILFSLYPKKCSLMHSVLGIAGEFFEVFIALDNDDAENFLEESGDIYFYIQDVYDNINEFEPTLSYDSIESALSDFVDSIKKHIIYNQDLNLDKLHTSLDYMDCWLQEKLEAFGFTKDDALQHNINKLNKRYPLGSYSDQQAKERADKNG